MQVDNELRKCMKERALLGPVWGKLFQGMSLMEAEMSPPVLL